MRWLLLVATLLSWLVCVTRHGPGAMGFWLFVGTVGALVTVVAFAQARIEANAQPELSVEALRRDASRQPPPQA